MQHLQPFGLHLEVMILLIVINWIHCSLLAAENNVQLLFNVVYVFLTPWSTDIVDFTSYTLLGANRCSMLSIEETLWDESSFLQVNWYKLAKGLYCKLQCILYLQAVHLPKMLLAGRT